MTEQKYTVAAGYYPSPWPCEDGGPQRLQVASGVKGLNVQAGESLAIKASRRICTGNPPICGISNGSVTKPPLYCPQRNIIVTYDSSNTVVRAWRHNPDTEELTRLWTRHNFGMGGHTLYYPDTGEIVTADYQSLKTLRGLCEGENSVVLDIETGLEKARVPMGNYLQSLAMA